MVFPSSSITKKKKSSRRGRNRRRTTTASKWCYLFLFNCIVLAINFTYWDWDGWRETRNIAATTIIGIGMSISSPDDNKLIAQQQLQQSQSQSNSNNQRRKQALCTRNPYLSSLDTINHTDIELYRHSLQSIVRERAITNPANKHDHERFRVFRELAQCKPNNQACIGGPCRRDVSKIMCGIQNLQQQQQQQEQADENESSEPSPCIVYSIGGNNQWQFERGMLRRSSCHVHTFDCTGPQSRFTVPTNDTRLQFHYECLRGGRDYDRDEKPADIAATAPTGRQQQQQQTNNNNANNFYTLQELTSKYNHKQIDLLKMDIEGFEYQVFEQFTSMKERDILPMQISVELHYQTQFKQLHPHTFQDFKFEIDMVNLAIDLLDMGYVVVKRDDNRRCKHCTELTLIRIYC